MTKNLSLFALLLASFIVVSYAIGQDASDKKAGKTVTTERIVVPTEGVTEFTVTGRSTLFRLSISTPSGGTIDIPVITGNAQHLRTAEIIAVGEGGEPLIGALTKEFVFRGTAAGKVKIEIKRTVPTSPMPVVEVFNVTIK